MRINIISIITLRVRRIRSGARKRAGSAAAGGGDLNGAGGAVHTYKELIITNRHLFTIPIKLFTNMNMNNEYIKGKYICPLFGLI